MVLRDTYGDIGALQYRLKAACALLGVTDNTLRGYADNSGLPIKRASDDNPASPSVRVFELDTVFALAHWRCEQGYTKRPRLRNGPLVLTIDVIKGGTGKTTTAVELAVHLQLQGLRVLLIDLDTQASATQLMGYESDLTEDEAEPYGLTKKAIVNETFASVLLPFIERRGPANRRELSEGLIKKPFGEHGPHLVPSDAFLCDVEQVIANAKGPRELCIRQLLAAATAGQVPGFDTSGYDVVLFDCPPNVSFTSTSALAAADFVIAPIRLDAFSVKGLTKLMRELNSLETAYQLYPDLVILPTHYAPMLPRIGRMQTQLNEYREFQAPRAISASEEFPKSLDSYLPLTLQKPTSNAAKEYRVFAEYMASRILAKAAGAAKTVSKKVG